MRRRHASKPAAPSARRAATPGSGMVIVSEKKKGSMEKGTVWLLEFTRMKLEVPGVPVKSR